MSILHLQRKTHSISAPGAVSEIASVRGMSGGQIITAVRTSNLKLISWRASGPITKLADSGNQAGPASHIDMARGSKVVTACRTGDDAHKLISWTIDPGTGSITRAGDSGTQAGTASQIRIVAVLNTLFVTAFRSGNGRAMLISWRLNSDRSLARLGDSADAGDIAAEVSLLRLATTGGSTHNLVTPIFDGAGNLKIIRWAMTTAGAFTRAGDSGILASGADSVRVSAASLNGPVVAYLDQFGQSKLIVCALTSDGRIQRLSGSGTEAGDLLIDSPGGEPDGVVSACRFPGGAVILVGWSVASDGAIARRTDNRDDGNLAAQITLVPDAGVTGLSMVTAALIPEGALRLVGWGQGVVRLHFKLLVQPRLGVERMLAATAQVFNQAGIRVEHASTEFLDLGEEFLDVEVGSCSGTELKPEQIALFQNRNNVRPNDVVIYVVRGIDPIMSGCARHPPGRPGAIVASFGDEWVVAHEVGHVLGLRHVGDSNRLMFDNGTVRITNPPPDLVAAEAATMLASAYTV